MNGRLSTTVKFCKKNPNGRLGTPIEWNFKILYFAVKTQMAGKTLNFLFRCENTDGRLSGTLKILYFVVKN